MIAQATPMLRGERGGVRNRGAGDGSGGRSPITAEMIARISLWARRHDTTFTALVAEWAPRGGMRALARHIEVHEAA